MHARLAPMHCQTSQKLPKSLQKMKCCMMGNLDSTSTWYIFTMPLFTCEPRPQPHQAETGISPCMRCKAPSACC